MSDSDLLEEIKDSFAYCQSQWDNDARSIYKQGDIDMRYAVGDPWEYEERKAREDAKRPCLCMDELGQYINQRINDVRQNKRAIKVAPAGNGANDKTAELRADIIRTIEAKGGMAAYICAFENALQRSFGFWAIYKRRVAWDSLDYELYIRIIRNPRTVYIDPDTIEAVAQDMRYAFIFQEIPKTKFIHDWPKAEIKDFTTDMMTIHPEWIKERTIQVAEYWKMEMSPVKIYLVPGTNAAGLFDRDNPRKIISDDLPEDYEIGEGGITTPTGTLEIIAEDDTERPDIHRYMTNGVEILETTEWEGRWIPIVPVFGKEYWLDQGTGSKRVIESLIRKARDAQMKHNYVETAEVETVGQLLKAPYIGYEGQFEGHEKEWELANRTPYPYLMVKAILDATGNAVLPLPQKQSLSPDIQGYLLVDEAARRSIQSAIGMFGATVGNRDVEKQSGLAIKALDQNADQGNVHFRDNLDQAIEHTGRIIEDMIPYVYDTERQMLLRKKDETHQAVTINKPYMDAKTQQVVHHQTDLGDHEVTIGIGPSYQTQRDEASDFVDLLVQELAQLPIPPEQKSQILALSVKLKELGPIGDKMAEILDPSQSPDQNNPAQLMQGLKQAQVQMAQMKAYTEQLEQKLIQLQNEKQAKIVDNQMRMTVEQMRVDAQVAIAEINAKSQQLSERLAWVQDIWKQLHSQAHEVGMNALDQANQQQLADQAAQQQQMGAEQPTNGNSQEQNQEPE